MITSVNDNNDANVATLDALFRGYIKDARTGVILGIFGLNLIAAAIFGLMNLKVNKS